MSVRIKFNNLLQLFLELPEVYLQTGAYSAMVAEQQHTPQTSRIYRTQRSIPDRFMLKVKDTKVLVRLNL